MKRLIFTVIILTLIIFSGCNSAHSIGYFKSSIDYCNKANGYFNSPGIIVKPADVTAAMEYYQAAFDESKRVDVSELNNIYRGFGDHYKSEFAKGIEMILDGNQSMQSSTSLGGQILLDKWGSWYRDNYLSIKSAMNY